MEDEKVIMEAREEENVTAKEYGQVLKRRRKDRGIPLCELSVRTGINQEHLTKVELGLIDLTEPKKRRIEKFLRRQPII